MEAPYVNLMNTICMKKEAKKKKKRVCGHIEGYCGYFGGRVCCWDFDTLLYIRPYSAPFCDPATLD